MDGPYRDLGEGFARLTGQEGARRGPSRIAHVEDALLELLRNARDANARHVLVASTLKHRRFRTLTVIDDGAGIPEAYADLVFEPGVTTRHLDPVRDPSASPGTRHGAGLALYHVRQAALSAEVVRASSPTSVRATFDTRLLPERTLQSRTRPSKTNLLATAEAFARTTPAATYHGPPARVLATLLRNRIIPQPGSAAGLLEEAAGMGLDVSLRTAQRVMGGRVAVLEEVSEGGSGPRRRGRVRAVGGDGAVLALGEEEKAEIAAILERAARAGYLEVEDVRLESRPGEVLLRARVYEPEDEYE